MVKKILSIAFAAALFMTYPLSVQAGQSMEIIENDIQSVSISVSGSVLHVSGANGQVLQVYNVTGVCLIESLLQIFTSLSSYLPVVFMQEEGVESKPSTSIRGVFQFENVILCHSSW